MDVHATEVWGDKSDVNYANCQAYLLEWWERYQMVSSRLFWTASGCSGILTDKSWFAHKYPEVACSLDDWDGSWRSTPLAQRDFVVQHLPETRAQDDSSDIRTLANLIAAL